MRKLFALYINEMIKISRKVSIIIILAITVVLVAGACGIVKYEEYRDARNRAQNSSYNTNTDWQKQNMNQQLSSYKTQLADVQTKLKTATEQTKASLESQQANLQQQVDLYQYAYDHDIYNRSSDYRWSALQQLYQYKADAAQLKALPDDFKTADMKTTLAQDTKYIDMLQKVVDNKDYNTYIDFSNDQINSDKSLSQGEKDIKIQSNALRLKHNPTGKTTDNDVTEVTISEIESMKLSLLNNIDNNGANGPVPMTSERRDTVANNLAVTEYKFENNIGVANQNGTIDYKRSAFPTMNAFGYIMLVILMMILAGGSVSSELSTGSIKSLIIAPVRRWKIITAKFLSLLTVLLLSGLLVYGVSSLSYGIMFGFSSGTPYIYAAGGVAHTMSFSLYNFANLYAGLIEVFVYMVMALMLSIITKNTAASVGISMGIYFGGSIVHSLLLAFASGEWLKFLPFSNISVTSKIFPFAASDTTAMTQSIAEKVNTSLTFSLCYIAVTVLCMAYIAFDSFTRRDIK